VRLEGLGQLKKKSNDIIGTFQIRSTRRPPYLAVIGLIGAVGQIWLSCPVENFRTLAFGP
jgi:hypothetical protein